MPCLRLLLALIVLMASLPALLQAADSQAPSLADLRNASDADLVHLWVQGSRQFPRLTVQQRLAYGDALGQLARRCFFSAEHLPGEAAVGVGQHTVRSGESPRAILRRYGMRHEHLQLLNPDYDDRRLMAGQRLKVVRAHDLSLRLIAVRSLYRCYLFAWRSHAGDHLLLASYPIGIGLPDRPTPTGSTTVAKRVRNPSWTHPDTGKVLPAGDPENVLGGYWIGLAAGENGRFRGIGLHGYTGGPEREWLEKQGSRGCLRLRQRDIGDLFSIIGPGVPVTIK